ncbi:hypothetical protein ANN_14820 [Periplaneta americana]|uniref:HTH psq-type domain-containing protein n=1 Tax=Periplaneta americana TaxID=6978 RepID=A0ABQ8SXC5_PERAM|nr:hypothetical protein ANN_14820 [Periplaneta americana]
MDEDDLCDDDELDDINPNTLPQEVEEICAVCEEFGEDGEVCVNKQSGGSRRRVSEEKIEEIRAGFQRSPQKLIRRASRQFNMPRSTVHRVLHKQLRLYPYKIKRTIYKKPYLNESQSLTKCLVSLRLNSVLFRQSLMLAGNEFQSLGRAIVKEDEYEEVRWDGIVSIVSWRERGLPRVTLVRLIHEELEIPTIQEYISNQAFCTYTKSYSSTNPLISSLGNYNPALDKHKRPKSVLHPLAWNDNVQDEYQLEH